MRQDIQRIALAIGKSGCYYLSVLHLAEGVGANPVDPLKMFSAFSSRGWVDDADAFMQNPAAIIGYLTASHWWVKMAGDGKRSNGQPYDLPLDYQLKRGEFEILRFERTLRAGESQSTDTAHFVVGSGTGPLDMSRVAWDPWLNSRAVGEGKLVSRRIFGR